MKDKEKPNKPEDCTSCEYRYTCKNAMYGSYTCKQKDAINSHTRKSS